MQIGALIRSVGYMTEHEQHVFERYCDVAVVDGSATGLAAALQLGRRRRSVIVVDDAARDTATAQLLATEREEVRRYGCEVLAARVVGVTRDDSGRFRVELAAGHVIVARRVLTATELPDLLPDIDERELDGQQLAADGGTAAAASANEADWDQRYGGAQLWSGNPNGSLVDEAGGLPPGRALDVGAGEGGDAIWLAEQGWAVTANDISRGALDRITAEAGRRGLRIDCNHADANGLNAFPAAAFDLVSAMYAAIPRTPDDRGVRNLLDAVAPGGTLLVVSHDVDAMRARADNQHGGSGFDAEAFVRVEDFAGALADSSLWDIETHGKRPRPPGAATSGHHVDDVVLRARRRAD